MKPTADILVLALCLIAAAGFAVICFGACCFDFCRSFASATWETCYSRKWDDDAGVRL